MKFSLEREKTKFKSFNLLIGKIYVQKYSLKIIITLFCFYYLRGVEKL